MRHTVYTIGAVENLQAVRVYEPNANAYTPALLDADKQLIVGFRAAGPYFPAGGSEATEEIAAAECGLVPGSEIYGFECISCNDDVYLLVC